MAGTLTVGLTGDHTDGSVAGWTIDSDAIFAGTNDQSGYTAAGITISSTSGGSIHAKQFYIDTSGNAFFAGALSAASGTFAGALSAATGSFTGDITVGSSNSIFKVTSSGIQLGHATFGSAPFRVTPAGALTAESGAIGGWTLAATTLSSGNITIDSGNNRIVISD